MDSEISAAILRASAREELTTLCALEPDRRPGSAGNREATAYSAGLLEARGWAVTTPEFDCVDWATTGGELTVGGRTIELTPSPYGLGVTASGPLRLLRDLADLERDDLAGSIIVLDGPLAAEPLTPKAYPFYGSEEHSAIIAALESAAPAAAVAVAGKYPALCGALDPFPVIEDGDFEVPAAGLRPVDAEPLFRLEGAEATIEIRSQRIAARARNVIGRRGPQAPRVTVIAHIDTKPGTPGAVDNAAGVIVLLMLAELLSPGRCPDLPVGVELLLVNGEDHYGAPGEIDWLAANEGRLDDVVLAINIDGAGYRRGRTAYSTYNLDPALESHVDASMADWSSLVRGPEFYQSDHAIFAMQGRAAVAFTTEYIDEMLETLFHASTDTPDQVDVDLLLDIANAIAKLLVDWPA